MLILAPILAQMTLFLSTLNYNNLRHWLFSDVTDIEDFLTLAFPKMTSHSILTTQHTLHIGLGNIIWNVFCKSLFIDKHTIYCLVMQHFLCTISNNDPI